MKRAGQYYSLDTPGPQLLVEMSVDPHIFSAHLDLGELANLLDGAGSAFFGTNSIEPLVEVDGVLASNNLVDGGLLLPLLLDHFDLQTNIQVMTSNRTCHLTSTGKHCEVEMQAGDTIEVPNKAGTRTNGKLENGRVRTKRWKLTK